MKRCCRCKRDLPAGDFYKASKRPDGLQTICKSCTRQHNQARKEADPDWWRPYRARYVKTDEQRQRDNNRVRDWIEANPVRFGEARRQRYWQNVDAERERSRSTTATRKARKLDQFVEHVSPLVVLERDDGLCGICGEDVDPHDFHVDHIVPLARGGEHSYRNTQAAHPRCNRKKWIHPAIPPRP